MTRHDQFLAAATLAAVAAILALIEALASSRANYEAQGPDYTYSAMCVFFIAMNLAVILFGLAIAQ